MHVDEPSLVERVSPDPDTVGVLILCTPASPQDTATVNAVLDRLRDRHTGPVEFETAERSPFGPTLFLSHDGDPQAVVSLLRTLAERFREAGLHGRIIPAETANPPLSDPLFQLWGVSAGLCATVAANQNRPPIEVVEHALQWCQVEAGAFYVRYGTGEYLVTPRTRGDLLRAALVDKGIVSITCHASRDDVRRVVFFDDACVVYEQRLPGMDGDAGWRGGVEAMTSVLEDLAPWLDYGFVRRQHFGAYDWSVFVDWEWPEKPHLPSGLVRYTRSSSAVALPDAFGVMVVSPSHGWSPSPQIWTSRQLPGRRTLVQCVDLTTVVGANRPDVDAVARMRADMAGVLMTQAMLS